MKKHNMTSAILLTIMATTAHAAGSHDDGHGADTPSSAVGSGAAESEASKTVNVQLLDSMKLEFDATTSVGQGDIVRFNVTNIGKIRHEFSIGSEEEQAGHRAMMRSMPDMVHEDDNSVTLEPGETKSLVWNFNGGSEVVYACNIPGHSEAGMIERVTLN